MWLTHLVFLIIFSLFNRGHSSNDVIDEAVTTYDITVSTTPKRELINAQNEDISQSDDNLILVSTINGAIYIVSQSDGRILWDIAEEEFPVLKLPQQLIRPLFVANPRDGGLYRMGVSASGRLEKLDLGIPEMVCVRKHFIFCLGN